MRTRSKPPSLVSMWMLDVFCCALGCVTLLWLLNTRAAKDNAVRAGSALEVLARTEADLTAKQAELLATLAEFDKTKRALNADLQDLRGRLLAMTAERDVTAKKLSLTRGDLASAEQKLTTNTARTQELEDLLARKQKESKDLATKLATATVSADELSRLLRTRERERDDLMLKAKAAADQLNDLDARLKSVAKEAQNATSSLAAMRKTGDELSAAQATLRDLQRKVDDSQATIIDLQGDKAKLADKVDQLRMESDTRFAGIAMTGKRVVFVVDTSGSMKLISEKIQAPHKWPTVVETVAKVMRSLPDLEAYQVVTFSRQAQYLFGAGQWQPYRGEASVRRVADDLRAIDPIGDTNIYDAMDLAFRLRPTGLDTVYFFSDGLPTSGAPLTADETQKLTEAVKSERLARHLRDTLSGTWNRPGGDGRRVRINAIGFFFESPEVGAFLWALTRDHDGSFVGMSRP